MMLSRYSPIIVRGVGVVSEYEVVSSPQLLGLRRICRLYDTAI